MLIWMLYVLVAVALLALLPFVVLGWWDVADRWRERRQEAGPEQLPGYPSPPERDAVLRDRELMRMAALCQIGQSAAKSPVVTSAEVRRGVPLSVLPPLKEGD